MQHRSSTLKSALCRFGEGVLLGAMAVVGATVVGNVIRWALARPIDPREVAQGLLIGTGLLLAGASGLYGATIRIDKSSLIARAYHGSVVCRLLLTTAALCSLVYFAMPWVFMLFDES